MSTPRPHVQSPKNPLVKQYAPARRRKAGLVYAEGERLAREALSGCWECERLLLRTGWEEGSRAAEELLRLAGGRGCAVERLGAKAMERISDCETAPPAGVLCRPPERLTRLPEPLPRRVLVLDSVQDPGNAGTLVRTAVAFGFHTVLAGDGVRPANEKFVRATAGVCFAEGALSALPDRQRVRESLQAAGAVLYRLEPDEGEPIDGVAAPADVPLALVAGNEARGPDPAEWPGAVPLRVPMREGVESLNVAASAAIVLYLFRADV